jgi:hypothetical protein
MYTLSLFHFTFSGVGKSSLVHLILKGSAIARPAQTVGCAVGVKVGTLALYFPQLHLLLFVSAYIFTVIISAYYLWKCRRFF